MQHLSPGLPGSLGWSPLKGAGTRDNNSSSTRQRQSLGRQLGGQHSELVDDCRRRSISSDDDDGVVSRASSMATSQLEAWQQALSNSLGRAMSKLQPAPSPQNGYEAAVKFIPQSPPFLAADMVLVCWTRGDLGTTAAPYCCLRFVPRWRGYGRTHSDKQATE